MRKLMETKLTPQMFDALASTSAKLTANALSSPKLHPTSPPPRGMIDWPELSELMMLIEFLIISRRHMVHSGKKFIELRMERANAHMNLLTSLFPLSSNSADEAIVAYFGDSPERADLTMQFVDETTTITSASFVRFIPFSNKIAIIQCGDEKPIDSLAELMAYHNAITRRLLLRNISWGGFENCPLAQIQVSTPLPATGLPVWPMLTRFPMYDDWRCFHILRAQILDSVDKSDKLLPLDQFPDIFGKIIIDDLNIHAHKIIRFICKSLGTNQRTIANGSH